MEMSRLNSPVRLAWQALAGTVLTMGAFAVLLIPQTLRRWTWFEFGWRGMFPRLIAVLVPLAVGFAITLRAESRLKSGLRDEKWVESALEPLRKLLNNRVLIICFCSPAVIGFGYAVAVNFDRFTVLFCFFLMPAQALLRWKRLLIEPASPFIGLHTDWNAAQPSRSEHWGESKYLGNDQS